MHRKGSKEKGRIYEVDVMCALQSGRNKLTQVRTDKAHSQGKGLHGRAIACTCWIVSRSVVVNVNGGIWHRT